jgi:hypothetical protein
MKLTAAGIEYTAQAAAEIGADPDELIREGEAVKEAGYRQAYQASTEILAGGATGGQMAAPAGSVAIWEATESAPGGAPITYITKVWSPAPDDGAIRIHSRMPDPEPLPDLEPEIEP